MSTLIDSVPLYVVWDDVRWDDTEGTLFRRGTYYGPHVDENVPSRWVIRDDNMPDELIGDATTIVDKAAVAALQRDRFSWEFIMQNRGWGSWEKIDDADLLTVWRDIMVRNPDKTLRARELLNHLNLRTYIEIETGFERLRQFEADDRENMEKLGRRKEEQGLLRERYNGEPYYLRAMKRVAFKEGKIEIERKLKELGFDVEAEIERVRTDTKKGANETEPKWLDHKEGNDRGSRQLQKDQGTYARKYVEAVLKNHTHRISMRDLQTLHASAATWSRMLKNLGLLYAIRKLLDRKLNRLKDPHKLKFLSDARDEIDRKMNHARGEAAPKSTGNEKCYCCGESWAQEGKNICDECENEQLRLDMCNRAKRAQRRREQSDERF
jgi:hypothetical protein